ncbi:MAG: vitamin K epoxide reductase family protein [bacterium]|nr:vitamin K epoxide reductase family protein [bacterium]
MILSIAILSIIGLVISWYVFTVENKIKKDPSYKPLCDISDTISCTKAFESQYASVFGANNAIVGMLFYVGMFLLALFEFKVLIFYSALVACFVSLFLAYLSQVKIKSFCLVCIAIYIVNGLLLLVSWMNV